MPRAIEHTGDNLIGLDTPGLGDRFDVFRDRSGEIDRSVRIARADGKLVHIGVGRIEQAALFRNRQHGQRVGAGLCGDRRPFERIERDVDFRRAFGSLADFFADIEHRRFVAFALADHHRSIEIEAVERVPHGLDGGGVGGLFVTAPD